MSSAHPFSRRVFLGGTAAVGFGLAAGGILGPARTASAAGRQIACWGDSLTQGAGASTPAASYPSVLAGLTDRTVYNGGRGGERSGAIAARQGGRPAEVSGQAVDIPAAGSVDVELANEVFFKGTDRIPVAGTLRGVPGSLMWLERTTHSFTRTDPGAATRVPIGSKFYPDEGRDRKGADTIIWAGHNDDYVRGRPVPDGLPSIEDNIAAMVSFTEFEGNPSHYLVLSLINGEDAGRGTDFYIRAIQQINPSLAATYGPDHYLDVHRFLVDDAIYLDGNPDTPTAADMIDIGQDITPISLRVGGQSAGHLNDVGYRLVAEFVYGFIVEQGWVPVSR